MILQVILILVLLLIGLLAPVQMQLLAPMIAKILETMEAEKYSLLQMQLQQPAPMDITRILQTVETEKRLLQMQTTLFLMNKMNMIIIGLHVAIGLALCFCYLLNNTRRNGNGNILSEEDVCSSSQVPSDVMMSEECSSSQVPSDVMMSEECSSSQVSSGVRIGELVKCRRRLNGIYKDIGTIDMETLTLQYRIDRIFGKECGIDKSIVHRVLEYFGLA